MDKDAKPLVKKPDVLRKLNAQNLHLIERGLLGDIPDRFKPPSSVPVRGQSNELAVTRPTGFLSSCLPVIPDSPEPYNDKLSPLDEGGSPLKKSFSFRDKFRISFFQKEKMEKPKWKTIVEEDTTRDIKSCVPPVSNSKEQEYKSSKRFWFFRNKDLMEKKEKHNRPIYKRSKSFEFLPKAAEKEDGDCDKSKLKKNSLSYAYGSSDTVTAASSVESLEYIADVYYDKVNNVCLKSIKELEDCDHHSGLSTSTSASSGIVVNIFKTESVQDLLDEFDKAMDMFSENYLSDSEPYTKTGIDVTGENKRRSLSFNTLPSPKIVQMTKANKPSDDFKEELARLLEVKRASVSPISARRGSVTDWFVLEENPIATAQLGGQNEYRRAQKKPTQRVRRISSTKYVSNIFSIYFYFKIRESKSLMLTSSNKESLSVSLSNQGCCVWIIGVLIL